MLANVYGPPRADSGGRLGDDVPDAQFPNSSEPAQAPPAHHPAASGPPSGGCRRRNSCADSRSRLRLPLLVRPVKAERGRDRRRRGQGGVLPLARRPRRAHPSAARRLHARVPGGRRPFSTDLLRWARATLPPSARKRSSSSSFSARATSSSSRWRLSVSRDRRRPRSTARCSFTSQRSSTRSTRLSLRESSPGSSSTRSLPRSSTGCAAGWTSIPPRSKPRHERSCGG